MLTKDTIMEDPKLTIKEHKEKVRCSKCSYEDGFKFVGKAALYTSMPTLQCPKCDNPFGIIWGKNCIIRSIKIII